MYGEVACSEVVGFVLEFVRNQEEGMIVIGVVNLLSTPTVIPSIVSLILVVLSILPLILVLSYPLRPRLSRLPLLTLYLNVPGGNK